jgi:hypothetical protein
MFPRVAGLISLCTNPVSTLSVPIQTSLKALNPLIGFMCPRASWQWRPTPRVNQLTPYSSSEIATQLAASITGSHVALIGPN